jgi:translation elongation factor EF-Tu-like GTPase
MTGVAEEPALFEVEDHFELRGRGVVVLGQVRRGQFRAGMRVAAVGGGDDWPLAGVEIALLSVSPPRERIGLVFREHPGLAAMREAFAVGALLEGREAG